MINITTFFLYRRFLMELELLQLHHYNTLLPMLRVCWWDMIHHHDYQLLTVQKEVLHIPLWGSLVFGAREVSAAHLTGTSALPLKT
jgi:hypothetical protein